MFFSRLRQSSLGFSVRDARPFHTYLKAATTGAFGVNERNARNNR